MRVALPGFIAGAVALAGAQPSRWPAVEQVYHQQIKAAGIVGSSLVLVRDGAVVASAVDGYQDLDAKRPVDDETIYHWASITKTFTGIAIMQLRDRGLLSLDDPIVKHVPEFRQVHNPYGDISQVTIRHMMAHSSGLRAATWPWGGDQPWHPFEPTAWEQLVAMLPYTQLNFAPGTKYSYSGLDFIAHSGDQNGFISHFYLHRPSRTAYIVSFNTDVSASKTNASRPTTRQVDATLRDTIIREVLGPHSQ